MAYSVPAASAVDFAVTRRPTRLHALPGLSGAMLMDGPLVPPEAPRLRRRALASWVPAGERAAVGSVGMTGLAERDVRRGEQLQLAAPHGAAGVSRWVDATKADLRRSERLQRAGVVVRLPEVAGWSAIAQRDGRLSVRWTAAGIIPAIAGREQAAYSARPAGYASAGSSTR